MVHDASCRFGLDDFFVVKRMLPAKVMPYYGVEMIVSMCCRQSVDAWCDGYENAVSAWCGGGGTVNQWVRSVVGKGNTGSQWIHDMVSVIMDTESNNTHSVSHSVS